MYYHCSHHHYSQSVRHPPKQPETLYGFSSISQAGYIMLAVLVGTRRAWHP